MHRKLLAALGCLALGAVGCGSDDEGTFGPGNTTAVVTRDGWSIRCIEWSGAICTHPQMSMACTVCGAYTTCGDWHDITTFNNGSQRTSQNFCAIATGDPTVVSEGSGGAAVAPRGCGWHDPSHPICETGRATYHAGGTTIDPNLGLLLDEPYCSNDTTLLTLECAGW